MARAGQSRRRHTGFDVTGPAPEPGAQSRGGGNRRGGGYRRGRAAVGPGTHGEGRGKGARPERGCGAWPEAQSRAAGVWARPGAGLTRLAGKCRPGFLLRGRGGGEGARGRGKGGRKGGPDSLSAVVCRADPGLPQRRSAPSCRPDRPPGTPARAWSTRTPSPLERPAELRWRKPGGDRGGCCRPGLL